MHTGWVLLPDFLRHRQITNKMVFKRLSHLDVIPAYRYQVNLISRYCPGD